MVLYISVYSIRSLFSPFSAISRRFVTTARVGDDILDLCGLLIVTLCNVKRALLDHV